MDHTKQVRVRFAPSPTGGLHLGGVRTVLYNYLFAKQHGGKFILRIEDTDQNRYVEGAEAYILKCLEWCGLLPDEGPEQGGEYGPYRQSERKASYRQYAEQLIAAGNAYYAFDTTEDLEAMRERLKTAENPSPQYNHLTRGEMRNSLSMDRAAVESLLDTGTPYVVRIKMPVDETVTFTDAIRGEVSFQTSLVDDKVLLKADGMPTYHLAVVVDDYAMKITHAFRGEEWLPSAPVHILLWKYLGWENDMPQWSHLPLIMKPDGHGKLSKRDGDRLGFPVFAMDWTDPRTGETATGFKERGFLPEAFVNMLAMLGWNDGSGQEIFTIDELIQKFALERVHKGGAKFDFEKAKWYNAQYIAAMSAEQLIPLVRPFFAEAAAQADEKVIKIISLIKERCTLLTDFREQGLFFFEAPQSPDFSSIKAKWNDGTYGFFQKLTQTWSSLEGWNASNLETAFTEEVTAAGIKKGEVMLPLRIMLVGGKYGPGVFDIADVIGKTDSLNRIRQALDLLRVAG